MEALLSFVPEAAMWQRQVLCEPDLNVVCATEEQVYDWIATDSAEARVLSRSVVDGEAWALVVTSWSEPMWMPEARLEQTELPELAIVSEATACFGSRALVEWVPVEPDLDAEWLQVDAGDEYVLFRRWDEGTQRASGPVMRASAFDVIRREPLTRPVRPVQDHSDEGKSLGTLPPIHAVPLEIPDAEAAPRLLGLFLKSAISSDGSAPVARIIPDKLAAMSVDLPTALPAMEMIPDQLLDFDLAQPTTRLATAVAPEVTNRSDASATIAWKHVSVARETPREANEPTAGSELKPSPRVESTAAARPAAPVDLRARETSPHGIEFARAGDEPEADRLSRKPVAMARPDLPPAAIGEPVSGAEQQAEDRLGSAPGEQAPWVLAAPSASDAVLPGVSDASARAVPTAGMESDPARPTAMPPAARGTSPDMPVPAAAATNPATFVEPSTRSVALGEPGASAHHAPGMTASALAGASVSGAQPARPPAPDATIATVTPVAEVHGASPASGSVLQARPVAAPFDAQASPAIRVDSAPGRETRRADDAGRAHSRSEVDLGRDTFESEVAATDVRASSRQHSSEQQAAAPVSRESQARVPSPMEPPRWGDVLPSVSVARDEVGRPRHVQHSPVLPPEPAVARASNAPLPSPSAADEITASAASQSSRRQPATETMPAVPATPRQLGAPPPGPGDDRTSPAALRQVPVPRPAVSLPPRPLAPAQPRPGDDRHAGDQPVAAQPMPRNAAARKPLASVRAAAAAPPVIHIPPAVGRRENGRDVLGPSTMPVIRNVSLGPVVVEVGEPEQSAREHPRKIEPGSLLASIPPPSLRGFS